MNVTLPMQDTNVNKFASTKTKATVVLARRGIAWKAMTRTVQVTAIDVPEKVAYLLQKCTSAYAFRSLYFKYQYIRTWITIFAFNMILNLLTQRIVLYSAASGAYTRHNKN